MDKVVDSATDGLPVPFAAALLLGIGWTGARVPGLAKVAWKMLLWGSSTIGKTNVVTISRLVGASHCGIALASYLDRHYCLVVATLEVNAAIVFGPWAISQVNVLFAYLFELRGQL